MAGHINGLAISSDAKVLIAAVGQVIFGRRLSVRFRCRSAKG